MPVSIRTIRQRTSIEVLATVEHHPRKIYHKGTQPRVEIYLNKNNIINIISLGGNGPFGGSCQIHGTLPLTQSESEDLPNLTDEIDSTDIKSPIIKNPAYSHQYCPPEIHRSCFCVRFIAEHTKLQEDSTKV